jgi:hypothetical protein
VCRRWSLDVSQTYGPWRPLTWIVLPLLNNTEILIWRVFHVTYKFVAWYAREFPGRLAQPAQYKKSPNSSSLVSGVNYADALQNPNAKASTPDPALAAGPNGNLDVICYVPVVAAKIPKVPHSLKIDSKSTYNTVPNQMINGHAYRHPICTSHNLGSWQTLRQQCNSLSLTVILTAVHRPYSKSQRILPLERKKNLSTRPTSYWLGIHTLYMRCLKLKDCAILVSVCLHLHVPWLGFLLNLLLLFYLIFVCLFYIHFSINMYFLQCLPVIYLWLCCIPPQCNY